MIVSAHASSTVSRQLMDSNAKNCYACVCIAGRGDDKGSQFSCDDISVLLPNNSNNNDDIEVVVTWDARRLQAFAVFDDSSQRLTGEQQSPMGLGIIAHSLGGTLTNFISIEICHRHVVNVSLVVNTDRPGRQAGQIKRVRALHDGDELRAAGSNQVLYILSSPKCSTVGAVVAAAAAVAAGANQSHTIFICLSVCGLWEFMYGREFSSTEPRGFIVAGKFTDGKVCMLNIYYYFYL